MLTASPDRAMYSHPSRSEVTYKRSRGVFGEYSNLCICFLFGVWLDLMTGCLRTPGKGIKPIVVRFARTASCDEDVLIRCLDRSDVMSSVWSWAKLHPALTYDDVQRGLGLCALRVSP
ncbi:hypothetical protein YC2023_006461 [Brassica napus]